MPTSPEVRAARSALLDRLDEVPIAEAHRLRRRIRDADSDRLDELTRTVDRSAATLRARHEALPVPEYPEHLPVSARHDDIAEAIREHQVVVVAGETGSGKTTQIPKICLELGRGICGRIGHTQPRRLAARTVAGRIAEELDVELGHEVGYAVRFDDRTGPDTAIKLMTDGILLSEIRRDRLLRAYDTIIIDEAHERSLNIDFLLGYLRQILPRRPDLKVIITSATIDPERFARHFADADGTPAPVVEVSGRTYPVEIRYRPPRVETGDRIVDVDPFDALADGVAEVLAEGDGDVLVFLSGEREIRDAEEVLRGRRFRDTEIFPLYARLTTAEQNKAFRRHSTRRVVLSTNIAETSVTVPGIRYVVDTGLARISRYSTRTKVQRLPIEPVSQASAAQRAGRCGRVAEGVCIRLYSEEDFEARPEFTDPEILRTSLASVILSMADLDLGPVDSFPFVEPPDHRAIRDGRTLLHELGAIEEGSDGRPRLTRTGRDMAALPLDPRLARMLVEAHRNASLDDVAVVVAGLTIQDVRERPAEVREKADALHRRFRDPTSDFLGYLNLWRYLAERRGELSGGAFRRLCRDEYLNWLRIREWQDLTAQLLQICGERGWRTGGRRADTGHAADDDVHRALLSGLLSNVGMRMEDGREYLGARGVRFQVFPGSAVAKKPPRWVMASELVETSRLWARDVARIDPAWIEKLAGDLVRRQYSEPHWSTTQGAAMVYEKVTLYGLPVVEGRRILLSRVDPEAARELLVRHGIVEGGWDTRIPVLRENAEAITAAREMETRSRRRDLVIDDETVVAFYLQRLPDDVTSGRHLESWWRKTGHRDPEHLRLDPERIRSTDGAPSAADFPPTWKQGERTFPLVYTFDPGVDADGITVRIPLAQLATVSAAGFEWLVPGVREELYTEMLRTLPKFQRRLCSPPAEYAALLAGDVRPRSAPLAVALAEALSRRTGSPVEASDFHPERLPEHLRMRFDIVDDGAGSGDGDEAPVVASGTDLAALRSRLAERVRTDLRSRLVDDRGPFADWDEQIGDLPDEVGDTSGDAGGVVAYPALERRADGLHVTACPTPGERRSTQTATLLELLSRDVVSPAAMARGRAVSERLALTQYPDGGVEALVHDASVAAASRLLAAHGGPVFTLEGYRELRRSARAEFPGQVSRTLAAVLPALVAAQDVRSRLDGAPAAAAEPMRRSLADLVGPTFLLRHPASRLAQLERHVRAAGMRIDLARSSPGRHAELTALESEVEARVEAAAPAIRARSGGARRLREIRWMLAEYRVSLFAQSLGTSGPVSPERISRAIAEATGRKR